MRTTSPPAVEAAATPLPGAEMDASVGGRKQRPPMHVPVPGSEAGHAALSWPATLTATLWFTPTPAAVLHVTVVCAVEGACEQPAKASAVPAAPPNLTKLSA